MSNLFSIGNILRENVWMLVVFVGKSILWIYMGIVGFRPQRQGW